MIKALAVVALLAVAQIVPSCGSSSPAGESSDAAASPADQVIGWIDQKVNTHNADTVPWLIQINGVLYGVPYQFWMDVKVGDLVKYDGREWKVLQRGGPRP